VREHGFLRLLDGEGGDELFDLAWLLGDLVRVGALDSLVPALASRGTRARLFRDLALPGLLGPWSKVQPARVRRRIRQRRPWVRSAFWASACFDEAWEEAMAYARRPSARARIPQILGAHGRYWRAQMLAKGAAGIEGASPLLAREVVELVGSLHPRIAMNPRHSKWLLRKHAERRLPAAVAWRPKSEPMNDWLVRACVSQDANVARAIANIRSSPTLSDLLDTEALVGAVQECRSGARERLEAPLAELFAFVEWAAAVEARHGF
jgi:asparagine synthetase B (glutamine-hydrolysing)